MNRAAEILKKHEGFSAKPYRDVHPDGRDVGMAVGYGRNLDRRPLNRDEAYYLLVTAMAEDADRLTAAIPCFHRLGAVRQQALVIMAYQLGVNGVVRFRRMIAHLDVGDHVNAAAEALDSQWARNFPRRAEEVAHMLKYGEFPI